MHFLLFCYERNCFYCKSSIFKCKILNQNGNKKGTNMKQGSVGTLSLQNFEFVGNTSILRLLFSCNFPALKGPVLQMSPPCWTRNTLLRQEENHNAAVQRCNFNSCIFDHDSDDDRIKYHKSVKLP